MTDRAVKHREALFRAGARAYVRAVRGHHLWATDRAWRDLRMCGRRPKHRQWRQRHAQRR